MTIESLVKTLTDAGFDTYLGSAPDGTRCPYVVLEDIEHENFGADNRVYQKTTELTIRLVESERHNFSLIDTMEDTLDSVGLFYSSEDVTDSHEHVCETHYQISFYGGNKNA